MRILLFIAVSVIANFDHELDYLAALRNRGLHRLAEVQCKQLLDNDDVGAAQRVRVNIELSKALTATALNSRQPQRDEHWKQATSILNTAINSGSIAEPRSRVLLELQLGLTMLEQAEWARREGEIQATADEDWQTARSLIRAAISQLKKVDEKLALLNRQRAGREDSVSSSEIAEMRRNNNYHLARAYRNQAITYAKNPQDQVSSLTGALQHLESLANDAEADELVWKSRMDHIECYRLRGDLKRASQLLTDANTKNVPPEFTGRVAAEGVRLALAARNPQAALQFVQSQKSNLRHPELELARVETLIAIAELKNATNLEQYRREAAETAARLGRRHGTYWGMRGEILITRLSGSTKQTSGSSLLDTTAKTLLKRDQPDKAIDTFVRAAEQAERNGKPDEAFDYLHKAAIVNHQEGQLRPAIDRFRLAAKNYPKNPKASEAHLLAVFDAAELYQTFAKSDQAVDAQKALSLYEQLLEEHLLDWPNEKSANQARIWYGRLVGAQGNWKGATDIYREVIAGSEHAKEAYSRLGTLYQRMFAKSSQGVSEAREWMSERLSIERDLASTRVLAIELAKLSLFVAPQDYDLAESCLRRVPAEGDRLGEDRGTLTVLTLAGKNQPAAARGVLARILPLPADRLLELLRGLQPIRDARPEDVALKSMAVDCLKLLQTYKGQLKEEDELLVQQTVADASSNRSALAVYKRLAAAHPKNRRIQLRYAELISHVRDRTSREAALKQWRLIVRQSKPRSPEWFRGKLGVAQTHFDKGEYERAKEMIELLATLYPKLGGPELSLSFRRLLSRAIQGLNR